MTFRWTLPLLAALALLFVHRAPAAEPTPAAPASPAHPNVIVVLIDALRADHLGPYGYDARPTTPNLDRFAKRSVVFEHTIAQAGWTVPSVASLFTSKDPQAHQVLRYNKDQRMESDELAASHDTVAEMFHAAGYQTASLKKTVVIDTNRGMSQGFDIARIIGGDMAEGHSAGQLTDAALTWMDTERDPNKPFFLYLHYMDSHSSYRPPEPWYSQWKGSYAGTLTGDHMEVEKRFVSGKEKPSTADIDYLEALYDAEIQYWDSQFGRLMQALVVKSLDPNTIVVVVADHGEAFYEHGEFFHGHVWQENLHVPFIVKAPGVTPGRLAHWTQLIDVGPTVADLAGVPRSVQWTGRSQVGALHGETPPAVSVYGEYGGYRTLISADGLKLMTGAGEPKLFNLATDPGEKRDLGPVRGMVVDRMKAELEARYAAAKGQGDTLPKSKSQALTPEQIEQLKQLGYIE